MLTDKEIDALLNVFQGQMQEITDDYLRKMGEHIRKIGTLYPSDVNRLIEMKRVNRNISHSRRLIAQYSGKSMEDIAKIFVAVAQSDERFMRGWFGNRATSANMRRVIEAQLRVTYGSMKNLSQTTLDAQPYRHAVDAAINAVQSGVSDYNSAVRRALKDAAVSGLKVQYPSGVTRRADTAVRQNVLDGVRAVNQQMLYSIGEEFGADGVEISAHMLCAEDHLPYQGRQYDADRFREIQSTLARPFGMWNCRHTMYPIIMGVSKPAYSEDELKECTRYSTEEITIGDRKMTRYEWSQEMRRTETAIRASKDAETALTWNNDKIGAANCHTEQERLKEYYMTISEKAGLDMSWARTGIGKSGTAHLGEDNTTFGTVDPRKVERQIQPVAFLELKAATDEIKDESNPFSTLKNETKDGILIVTGTIPPNSSMPKESEPNAVLDYVGKLGGVSRYIYDDNGRILYRVDNHDHSKPKYHKYENGEHFHTAIWKGDELKKFEIGEIPKQLRALCADILKKE